MRKVLVRSSNATCAAESANSTAVLASVYFKRGISSNTDGSWSFYARSNFTPPFHPAPAYRGCDAPPGSLLPWCNRSARCTFFQTHGSLLALILTV